MLQDIMYLRTLKAARSAKNFWEEIFMPKSQLGGILYIFPPGPRGGCLYFPLKHKSAMYTFVQQRGGGSQITKVCTNVHTCMYICHLAPPPPPPGYIHNIFRELRNYTRWGLKFKLAICFTTIPALKDHKKSANLSCIN